ncbi:MAG: SpoVR family protein [Planctomycetota bacterium]|nr:MAG: SpoVR family protein [Planctomycetota bacterium]REK43193.1 MAG: SpoVR family protein [Planctomycetota bacterium]
MAIVTYDPLPDTLAGLQEVIEENARAYGLDFFPTIFELVDADQLNAIAAYGGFPTRYPHWRFGMEYEKLAKSYHYGLSKIYELVINNDPCYAYLMSSNSLTDQKLVMAHVYGHCDFFKNNAYFAHTNRKMMDDMANHGNRIRRYMDRFGVEQVEEFIDCCLSIEDLIDIHSTFIQRRESPPNRYQFEGQGDDAPDRGPGRFQAKSYMDEYINPPDVLEAERQRRLAEEEQQAGFPQHPEADVMLFLMEHAPLKPWQLDTLAILRDEAYYFAPQAQTKIINEGWASFWHSTIMTQKQLEPDEVIHYCDHHAGTMGGSRTQLNPYKLGLELFRDIEDRWNKGRFGKDFEACDDMRERAEWNTGAGLGREKIFEVRRVHNDLTFIETFLTLDFCREHNFFQFGYNEQADVYEIESRAFPQIKQQLLFNLTNAGRPRISVVDGNYKNRGELLLEHRFNGVELKADYARDTLANLNRLWTRPVHIETVLGEKRVLLSYDGSEHSTSDLGLAEEAGDADAKEA